MFDINGGSDHTENDEEVNNDATWRGGGIGGGVVENDVSWSGGESGEEALWDGVTWKLE